ncbi:MAG: FAD-dependent oxidoreductase, partial [Lachnospiraceae bacterium]|nr:FAD-dependent oxidoreductase [Lachnospiraceae bacterium]
IDFELRRLVFGIWDYIKNSGKYPEAKNYALKRVYTRSGARESRRFLGDYLLTENDIEEKRDFPDAVCVGGWPMDVHAPLGIYDPGPATEFIPVTGLYNIPFRCLYSRDVENLMLAGRNISATHIALGSARVMGTCGCMGQAVGTAAACCVRLHVTPGKLGRENIALLQERLARADQTIVGRESLTPRMKEFGASASGERTFENDKVSRRCRLERDYGLALMLETERLDSIQIWAENDSGEDTWLEFELLEGSHRETFLPERFVKRGRETVAADFRGWLTLAVKGNRGEDGKLYLILRKNPALALGMAQEELPGAVTLRLYREDACGECNHDSVPLNPACGYRYLDHRYNRRENIAFRETVPKQRVFAPEMALNPYTRPYGLPNMWLAGGEYPATLILTAGHPVKAERLDILFDTDLKSEPLTELPGCLVRDFDVTFRCGEKSHAEQVRDNCRRQVSFFLKGGEVDKIEITIRRSWGGEAGIYGVNLW